MKIDRHNYEAFLLDQLEGKLSVEEQQELEEFLLLNPDCSSELMQLEPFVLEPEELPFPQSQILRKEFPHEATVLSEHNFDMFSIARMEGDLSIQQIEAHRAMVETDEKKAKQWENWQRTRLVAETLLLPGKDRLKRKRTSSNRIIWMSIISAAAVAAIIILFTAEPQPPQQESYFQAQQEKTEGQNPDTPLEQAVEQAVPTATLPSQIEPSDRQEQMTVRPPESLESGLHNASHELVEAEPVLPIQPEAVPISASAFNSRSMLNEPEADRITHLFVDPVPVHHGSLSLAQISQLGVQEAIEEYAEEKDFSLWKVADAGIRGINKLTGSDISLLASRDEDGEVSGFQLKSKRFSVTRPIGREE